MQRVRGLSSPSVGVVIPLPPALLSHSCDVLTMKLLPSEGVAALLQGLGDPVDVRAFRKAGARFDGRLQYVLPALAGQRYRHRHAVQQRLGVPRPQPGPQQLHRINTGGFSCGVNESRAYYVRIQSKVTFSANKHLNGACNVTGREAARGAVLGCEAEQPHRPVHLELTKVGQLAAY